MRTIIYGLFDATEPKIVRYIGRTSTLRQQFLNHQGGKEKTTGQWVRSVHESGSVIGLLILDNATERTAARKQAEQIRKHQASLLNQPHPDAKQFFNSSPIITLSDMKIRYARHILAHLGGCKLQAARALGISRNTLDNLLNSAETNTTGPSLGQ